MPHSQEYLIKSMNLNGAKNRIMKKNRELLIHLIYAVSILGKYRKQRISIKIKKNSWNEFFSSWGRDWEAAGASLFSEVTRKLRSNEKLEWNLHMKMHFFTLIYNNHIL